MQRGLYSIILVQCTLVSYTFFGWVLENHAAAMSLGAEMCFELILVVSLTDRLDLLSKAINPTAV